METKLTFRYDREGDILHIDKCPPYGEQDSEELPDEVVARLNPETGEVENIEVLFFPRDSSETTCSNYRSRPVCDSQANTSPNEGMHPATQSRRRPESPRTANADILPIRLNLTPMGGGEGSATPGPAARQQK